MLRKTALNRNGCMKMYARSFSSFPRSAIVCTCLVGIRRLSLGLMLIWFSRFASYRAHAPPIKNQYNSRRKAAFATYCTLCRRFYEFWEYRHARCSKKILGSRYHNKKGRMLNICAADSTRSHARGYWRELKCPPSVLLSVSLTKINFRYSSTAPVVHRTCKTWHAPFYGEMDVLAARKALPL